jgi:hypothetical protein
MQMTDQELHRRACAAWFRLGDNMTQPCASPKVQRRTDGTALVVLENVNGVLARYLNAPQTARLRKVSDEELPHEKKRRSRKAQAQAERECKEALAILKKMEKGK